MIFIPLYKLAATCPLLHGCNNTTTNKHHARRPSTYLFDEALSNKKPDRNKKQNSGSQNPIIIDTRNFAQYQIHQYLPWGACLVMVGVVG